MLGWIWYFIVGYVKIRIKGLSMEQFLNLTTRGGVRMRSVYRANYTAITASVKRRALPAIRAIAAERGCAVQVESEHGLPYLWLKLVRRKAFVAGLVLAAIALGVLSQFVFEVRMEPGLDAAVEQRVMRELHGLGLRPLAFKPSLDLHELEDKTLNDIPELSFLSIRIKGVRVTVKAVLKVPPPAVIDRNTPCSIVAAKDAVVDSVTVMYGEASVNAGDVVRPGQLLVRGMISGMPVHAIAQVMGKIWYRATARADLMTVKAEPTGRVFVTRTLWIGDRSYPWQGGDTPSCENYLLTDSVYKLPGIGVAVVTHTWTEVVRTTVTKDVDALRAMLEEKAFYVAQAGLPEGVEPENRHAEARIEGNTLYVDVYVQTVEPIGLEAPLQN